MRSKQQPRSDAERLRELIAQAGLTQVAFAREIDYGDRMIRYMLSGKRTVERVVMLAAEHLAECESTRRSREKGREQMRRTTR